MERLLKAKEIVAFRQQPSIWQYFKPETLIGTLSACAAVYSASVYSRVGFLLGGTVAFFAFRHIYLEWNTKVIRRLALTPRLLSLSLGTEKRERNIPLIEIAGAEVLYAHRQAGARKFKVGHAEFEPVLQHIKEATNENLTAHCFLNLKSGEEIVLRASYFPQRSFVVFIGYLHEYLTNRLNNKNAAIAPWSELAEKDAVLQQIQQISEENQAYLQADTELKIRLENTLRQACEMIYIPRKERDGSETLGKTLIARFEDAEQKSVFFFKDDYKEDPDAEETAAAENLIQSARENLALVEARIESYRKIGQELQRLAEKQIKRLQLNQIADDLKALQEQNTLRNLERQSFSEKAELFALNELAQLNKQIAEADTLEKTLLLKEHIALFTK